MGATKLLAAAAAGAALAVFVRPKLLAFIKRLRADVTLKYFNIDGLGEPIRLTLSLAGVPFTDHRFKDREEFMTLKPALTFGQVPAFFDGGVELVQSAAVMRYVAKTFEPSLYPSDPATAAKCDALIDQVKDMMTGRLVMKYKERFGFPETVITEEVFQIVEKKWFAETLPRHLSFFEAALERSGTPWLAGTTLPTIADIYVACQLRAFQNNCADKTGLPAALAKHADRVYALPAIAMFKVQEAKAK